MPRHRVLIRDRGRIENAVRGTALRLVYGSAEGRPLAALHPGWRARAILGVHSEGDARRMEEQLLGHLRRRLHARVGAPGGMPGERSVSPSGPLARAAQPPSKVPAVLAALGVRF